MLILFNLDRDVMSQRTFLLLFQIWETLAFILAIGGSQQKKKCEVRFQSQILGKIGRMERLAQSTIREENPLLYQLHMIAINCIAQHNRKLFSQSLGVSKTEIKVLAKPYSFQRFQRIILVYFQLLVVLAMFVIAQVALIQFLPQSSPGLLPSVCVSVLVSFGCYNKILQNEWLKLQKFCLTVWSLGSPRSRCQQERFHEEDFSQACR